MTKYSLVLGATGGIGKEFCRLLVKRSENLIISGRSKEKLEILKAELLSINSTVSVIVKECDLTAKPSISELFSFIKENDCSLSGLYFVSGIDTRKAFTKYTEDKISSQIAVNFESAVIITKKCLELRADSFDMLIVSSACGLTPMPYFSLYSATKSALVYFYKGLKAELKGERVKITVVCPGSVPTREDIKEDIKAQGLQGRLSKVEPNKVAEKSLKALKRNKTVFIPGFYNKLVAFISKLTPYAIKSKVIAKKFKNKEKDAF